MLSFWFVIFFSIPSIDSCLKVRSPKCECSYLALDSENLVDYAPEFFENNEISAIGEPSITADECTITLGCASNYLDLVIFDTDKTVSFGKYEASGFCDPSTQTWTVSEIDDNLGTYNRMYGLCANYTENLVSNACRRENLIKGPHGSPEYTVGVNDLGQDPRGCPQYNILCELTDSVCERIDILGRNATGTYSIRDYSTSLIAYSDTTCGYNGKVEHGYVTNIEEVFCTFEDCSRTCPTCDRPLIRDPTGDGYELVSLGSDDKCIPMFVVCHRTDQLVCSHIAVLARNATGTFEIQTSSIHQQAQSAITCARNGKYYFEAVTNIEELSCLFEDCI